MNEFIVVGAIDVVSQSVVLRVTDRVSRRCIPILRQPLVRDKAHVVGSLVRVVHKPCGFLRTHNCLMKRLQQQAPEVRTESDSARPGESDGGLLR